MEIPLHTDLQSHLQSCSVATLASLLRLIEPPRVTRKAELVARLAAVLLSERLPALVQALDRTQTAALAEAVHNWDGTFIAERFRHRHGALPAWGDDIRYQVGKPTMLRLFFPAGQQMPEDLRQRATTLVAPPAPDTILATSEPESAFAIETRCWNAGQRRHEIELQSVPVAVVPTEARALAELPVLLRLLQSGRLAVTAQNRRPTGATQRAVANVLHGGDLYSTIPEVGPVRAFAWPMLLQAGGMGRARGEHLQATAAGQQALAAEAAQVLRALWESWLTSDLLDELSRVETIRGQTGHGRRGLTDLPQRRHAISNILRSCPPGQWVAIAEFERALRAAATPLVVTDEPWRLYFCEAQYGTLTGTDDTWTVIEARYLLCFLVEYAATLGLIDLALVPPAQARDDFRQLWGTDEMPFMSRYDGLRALRVNALGRFCLGHSDGYVAESRVAPRRLQVLPTRDVVSTAAVPDPADVLVLDAFAVRTSERVWRLDRDRILLTAQAGRTLDELRRYLDAATQGELPTVVAQFLADVESRLGQIRDAGTARLFECADPAVALLIAADRRAGKVCLRAGERQLVVPAAGERAFHAALRALGYVATSRVRGAPRIRGGAGDAASDA